MKKYQRPTKWKYMQYHTNAYRMLVGIAEYFEISISEITFKSIIDFFETNYNILFVYFESDLMYHWFPKEQPSIKYDLSTKNTLALVDHTFCNVCSGMTVPDLELGRFVIYINQDVVQSRVMFTILHELTHIYFHIMNSNYQQVLISKTTSSYSDSYPSEISPLEDEANTIASILFLNDQRLLEYINKSLTFEQLKEKSEMSKSALHNRLMNFLMYNCHCQERYALDIVMAYRNNKKSGILTLQQFGRELSNVS